MNILSFDIEEWFHINHSDWQSVSKWPDLESRVYELTASILNALESKSQKATFFVLGWIAEFYPELLREIHRKGHDIGFHSYYHYWPIKQTKKEFEQDLVDGIALLSCITGEGINMYRAPNFSLCQENAWMLPILLDHGVIFSSSIKSGVTLNSQTIPNGPFYWEYKDRRIIEFPLNSASLFGLNLIYTGSGYFRSLPYSLIKFLYKKYPYNMAYFHPNDFDPVIPTPKELGLMRNWKNELGTQKSLEKFEKLLHDFTFHSLNDVIFNLGEDKLPVIKISSNWK